MTSTYSVLRIANAHAQQHIDTTTGTIGEENVIGGSLVAIPLGDKICHFLAHHRHTLTVGIRTLWTPPYGMRDKRRRGPGSLGRGEREPTSAIDVQVLQIVFGPSDDVRRELLLDRFVFHQPRRLHLIHAIPSSCQRHRMSPRPRPIRPTRESTWRWKLMGFWSNC